MKKQTKKKASPRMAALSKRDKTSPAIKVTAAGAKVKAGVTFHGIAIKKELNIAAPAKGYQAGGDYVVIIARGKAVAQAMTSAIIPANAIGGFHFSPGGNAKAEAGGDSAPAINPHSTWDRNFRPACKDPRGMAAVPVPGKGLVWCDIYLLGKNHLEDGTSKFGVTIADGTDLPQSPAGGTVQKFNYDAACAVMKHHGKQLLGAEEFFTAAFGVTEKTAAPGEPKSTGLDAERTSRWGLMQAAGNMWVWGTDGHPALPRASLFGGSWFDGDDAGSRRASLGDWPGSSGGSVGARGRSDHLNLG